MNNTNSNAMTVTPFFNPEQKAWSSATISTGTYNTRGYSEKEYKTKYSLMRAMIALGYSTAHPHSGETWNHHGKQYKVTFDYN